MTERFDYSKSIIAQEYSSLASRQEYESRPQIEGVCIAQAKHFTAEDGTFSEVTRLSEAGKIEFEGLPEMEVRQINFSMMIPGTTKAWHFHLNQDEVWMPTPDSPPLIIGLMDLREKSTTKGEVMRLILGQGKPYQVHIPRGVAHGVANRSQEKAGLIYLVSNHFDGTDEHRLPYDHQVGRDFWEVQPG